MQKASPKRQILSMFGHKKYCPPRRNTFLLRFFLNRKSIYVKLGIYFVKESSIKNNMYEIQKLEKQIRTQIRQGQKSPRADLAWRHGCTRI